MGAGHEGRPAADVTIEVSGLEIYTHHGVSEAEREIGQRLTLDVRLEPISCDATESDDVAETIDYGDVAQTLALSAQARSFKTLEALIAMLADELLEKYPLERVWIRAAKPQPPVPLAIAEVAVELWREAI
jgi:dihydroneopterin aldolase